MNLGQLAQLIRRILIHDIVFSHVVKKKRINAHHTLWLVTVGGKPSETIIFINNIEIIVGCGIKRHTDILWFEERLCSLVVASHEDVESTNTFLSLCREIKSGAIGKHEWPIDIYIVAKDIKTLERDVARPLVAYHFRGIEIPT